MARQGHFRFLISLSFLLLLTSICLVYVHQRPAGSVSFDCTKVTAEDQVAICSNEIASKLDDIANTGYRYLKSRYSKKKVNQLNKQILAYRQKCAADVKCIVATQIETIKIFKKLGAPVGISKELLREIESASFESRAANSVESSSSGSDEAKPSFKCGDFLGPDEREICANAKLSHLDILTTRGFEHVKSERGKQVALGIARQFLGNRRACQRDAACILRTQVAAIKAYISLGADIKIPNWASKESVQATSGSGGSKRVVQISADLPHLKIFNEMMVSHYEKSTVTQLEEYHKSRANLDRDDDIAVTGVTIKHTPKGQNNTAILIANSTYEFVGNLPGPLIDIELVAQALRYRNFDVHVFKDIKSSDVSRIMSVADQANKQGMLLVYYAGHGAIVDGRNSVILGGFNPKASTHDGHFLSIDDLLYQLRDRAFSSYFFVFDACRSFVGIDDKDTVSANSAGSERGLRSVSMSQIEPSDLSGIDYAISFSASEGQTALDGGANGSSPYADSFARNIRVKKTIVEAILAIRNDVITTTQGAQDPGLLLKWKTDVPLSSDKTVTVNYAFGPTYGGYTQYLRLPREAFKVFSLVRNETDDQIEAKLPTYSIEVRQDELAKADSADHVFCSGMQRAGFEWSRDCVEQYIEKKLIRTSLVTDKFPGMDATSEHRIRDGVVKRDSYFELSADLNNDGILDLLALDTNKYGGGPGFISPSLSEVLLRDFNKDGILDYVIQQEDVFVIIDGARWLREADLEEERERAAVESAVRKYFSPTPQPWCAGSEADCFSGDGEVLGGLATVAIFFDNGGAAYDDSLDVVSYRSFDDSWTDNREEHIIDDRTVYFDPSKKAVVMRTWRGEKYFPPVWQMK